MIKPCVILNGEVINIGDWDYQAVIVGIKEDGQPIYGEELNPLPAGAEVVDMEVCQSNDGSWCVVGYDPEPSELEQLRAENTELKLALTELAEAQEADKTEVQLALAEIAELVSGGGGNVG